MQLGRARQTFRPDWGGTVSASNSQALAPVEIGVRRALNLLRRCFHRVDHVNCSGFFRRHGNFHLGCLPDPSLPARTCGPVRMKIIPASWDWQGQHSPERHIQTAASVVLCQPGAGSGYAYFTHLFASSAAILTAKAEAWIKDCEADSAFWKPAALACKCLWKWLFVGHSHSRLKVALWMLHNMETCQSADCS